MKITIAATLVLAAGAFAQAPPIPPAPAPPSPETLHKLATESMIQGKVALLGTEGFSESTVTGMPYSAEEVNATTQTLMDGNRIVNTSTTKVYRDQQGRTRMERTIGNIGGLAPEQPHVSITINDPVAGAHFMLDPEGRTATKMQLPAPQAAMALAQLDKAVTERKVKEETRQIEMTSGTVSSSTTTFISTNGPNGTYTMSVDGGPMRRIERNAKTEDLGTSNMAGVPVKGTRTTMTIPAGTIGNDRDINIVNERWYSPDLKMNIMTKHSDPRSGETVFQVNNLTRANPDPSLFQVPGDYQVKDAKDMRYRFVTKE
jgi:hypothetical protein